jgi:hypothetical protein
MQGSNIPQHVRPTPPATRWTSLLGGAAICAAVIIIAYFVSLTFRDRTWVSHAEQQAVNFVYASPVLERNLGTIRTVSKTSDDLNNQGPDSCDVVLHVTGQKGNGTVHVELTRDGPDQWLISMANLSRGHRDVNLY